MRIWQLPCSHFFAHPFLCKARKPPSDALSWHGAREIFTVPDFGKNALDVRLTADCPHDLPRSPLCPLHAIQLSIHSSSSEFGWRVRPSVRPFCLRLV